MGGVGGISVTLAGVGGLSWDFTASAKPFRGTAFMQSWTHHNIKEMISMPSWKISRVSEADIITSRGKIWAFFIAELFILGSRAKVSIKSQCVPLVVKRAGKL